MRAGCGVVLDAGLCLAPIPSPRTTGDIRSPRRTSPRHRVADIKYGALLEVEEGLKQKQAAARRADRMLSDTVGPEEIATVVSKWTGIPVTKLQVGRGCAAHAEAVPAARALGRPAGSVGAAAAPTILRLPTAGQRPRAADAPGGLPA